jgi:hypothetical protein
VRDNVPENTLFKFMTAVEAGDSGGDGCRTPWGDLTDN